MDEACPVASTKSWPRSGQNGRVQSSLTSAQLTRYRPSWTSLGRESTKKHPPSHLGPVRMVTTCWPTNYAAFPWHPHGVYSIRVRNFSSGIL